jgi:hypothetical protein
VKPEVKELSEVKEVKETEMAGDCVSEDLGGLA